MSRKNLHFNSAVALRHPGIAFLRLSVLALRLPWRVWGPLSHLEYRHIFASLWRYAWMKTQQRGLNLIWLCQFWKKCRTNKNKSFCALLCWTRYHKWWCGAYQYCLKILLCCCIQRHCSFSFWDKFSSSHIFYIFIFLNRDIKLLFVSYFVTDLLSATWNYMDMYNLQTSWLNNLWMSAWTVCIAILNLRPHYVKKRKICLIGKLWVLIKQITQTK